MYINDCPAPGPALVALGLEWGFPSSHFFLCTVRM